MKLWNYESMGRIIIVYACCDAAGVMICRIFILVTFALLCWDKILVVGKNFVLTLVT